MKNIVSILAVVAATATSAAAAETNASVNWVGTEVDLPDACVFTKNADGEMSYAENSDDQGGVWTVTKAAMLKVSTRGEGISLNVVPDENIVHDAKGNDLTTNSHTAYAVTVDYTAGNLTEVNRSYRTAALQMTGDGMDITSDVTGKEKIDISDLNMGKHMMINLGGTATMNYSGALIDNGTYTLGHTATCVQ